jgi:lysophospholipase
MARFIFDFFTTRDGRRLRYGVFEPEKPTGKFAVLLNGQSEFIEKYLEVIHELNGRGLTVATFDWRGQGGSARTTAVAMKGHVGSFAEFDTDLESFMADIVAPRTASRPLLVGHSMGSHLALRALHDHPDWFRAAVLVAPMQAISTRGYPRWLVRLVAGFQSFAGRGEKFAWGMEKRDPLTATFDTQLCTSDPARFARTQAILKDHPQLRLGGPSWGWIEAAYRSMRQTMKPGYAEAIQTPVLVFAAGKDRIVQTEATRAFTARLPHGRYVEIGEAEHEILQENDAVRAQFWTEFDRFVGTL